MTLRQSNTKFFNVLGAVPLDNIGWEVIVRSHVDFTTIIAVIKDFEELTWSLELNGLGGGMISLDADDPNLDMDLLKDHEHLWEFYEDGILRVQWVGQSYDFSKLDDSETRSIQIQGPGPAAVLRWAVVLPPSFPTVPPYYWTFTDVPHMSMFKSFLDAAQSRGVIPYVTATFSATEDSSSEPWIDVASVQHENGSNLLDNLENKAEIAGADWYMRPGFQLDVRQDFGNHLENDVVFHVARTQLQRQEKVSRESIYNYVVAQDSYGAVSISEDTDSIDDWQRREQYVPAGNALDSPARQAIADAVLKTGRNQLLSETVQVTPHDPQRRVFVDYNVGDWIGIVSDYRDANPPDKKEFRVLAISGRVTGPGEWELELTLNSKFEQALEKLKKAADKLGGGTGTTLTAATEVSVALTAQAAVNASDLGDLQDVSQDENPFDILMRNAADDEWVAVPHTVNSESTPTSGLYPRGWFWLKPSTKTAKMLVESVLSGDVQDVWQEVGGGGGGSNTPVGVVVSGSMTYGGYSNPSQFFQFDTIVVDPSSIADLSDTDRIAFTAPTSGFYVVMTTSSWPSATTISADIIMSLHRDQGTDTWVICDGTSTRVDYDSTWQHQVTRTHVVYLEAGERLATTVYWDVSNSYTIDVVLSAALASPSGGAGGGGFLSALTSVPAPAKVSLSDEFDDGTLNPAWVEVQPGTSADLVWDEVAEVKGLSCQIPGGNGSDHIPSLLRPFTPPSADYALETSVILGGAAANYLIFGPVLADGTTWGAGTQAAFVMQAQGGGAMVSSARNFTNFQADANPTANTNHSVYGQELWLRLRVTSGVAYEEFSVDGVHWQRIDATKSALTIAPTPTHCGLMATTWGGSAQYPRHILFQTFRVRDLT